MGKVVGPARGLVGFFCLAVSLTLAWPLCAWGLDPNKTLTQYVRRVWNTNDGLPVMAIFSLLQQRNGYLWLGTHEGLVRFDGVRVKVFDLTNTPAITNNRITALCETQDGTIWIGCGAEGMFSSARTRGGGLVRYKNGVFSRLDARDGLTDDIIKFMQEDRQGNLWIATSQGALKYENGRFEAVTVAQGLPDNDCTSLAMDQQGGVWIGTQNGLAHWFAKECQIFTTAHGLPDNTVLSLLVDSQNRVWAGTKNGFACFENGQWRSFSQKNGALTGRVSSFLEDRDGNLWIGGYPVGLCRYRQGVFQSYAEKDGISSHVLTAREGREGELWVGTGRGLFQFRDGKFTSVSVEEGLSNQFTYPILEDRSRALWIGTLDGLNRLDHGVLTRFTQADGLAGKSALSLCQTQDGDLWIGSENGISRYSQGKFFQYPPGNGLASGYVRAIFEDTQTGCLWIGVGNGLTRFQNGQFHEVTKADGYQGELVLSVLRDRQGVIWFGNNNGLDCLQNGKFRHFGLADGLPDLSIKLVFEDSKGTLWLSSPSGLHRFVNGKISSVTTRHGLFDTPSSAFEDAQGWLWMGCNKGIFRLRRAELEAVVEGRGSQVACTVFGPADGMKERECNGGRQPAGCATRTGEIWFPTGNGAVRIDPTRLQLNQVVPPVVMEEILLDEQVQPAGEWITVNPGQRNLEVHYSALSFLIPERVLFRYRLEGFDQQWIEAGTRRTAYYSNLPPGEYTLQVRACNDDGLWNEAGATLRLRVIAPWWRRWWAFGLYGVLAGVLILAGIRFQTEALQRRNRLLEEKIRERTSEVTLQRDEIERQKSVLDRQHAELAENMEKLKSAKLDVERKNEALERVNAELIVSQQQADRIFSALAEALPGTVLEGKYRLEEKIGAGGFGVVFQATHLVLNRPIAVKVFKPSPGNDSAEAVERFIREGRSASRLTHPNAIHIFDSGISSEGIAYLVMELLQGRSLADELAMTPILSQRRMVGIVVPVCEALAEAHRLGIIHRDIKPENIYLTQTSEGETVKVVDFGIAKMLGDEISGDLGKLTGTGRLVGTPFYMAPERLEGGSYDGRSDVYSLGIVMFEMLCGQKPFRLQEGSGLVSLVLAHLQEIPPRPRNLNPQIAPGIESLMLRALEKDPAKRLTASELGTSLVTALGLLSAAVADAVSDAIPSLLQSKVEDLPTSDLASFHISTLETTEIRVERTNPPERLATQMQREIPKTENRELPSVKIGLRTED
ncbi:MAG: protein kinase [Blastocatellia bacterium]|nr:protein kinase [Blastocatellia bacterium]